MTTEQLRKELKKRERETQKLLRDDMPRIIGRLAVNRFRDNFRQGGFVDQTLQAWPVTRRQQSGGPGAGAKYGPLLSSRNRLMNATQYTAAPYRVRIFNPEEYAAIHNNGGVVHPTVTPKMRRYAWYRYFAAGGGAKRGRTGKRTKAPSPEAEMWRRMALTRKSKLTVHIPQRRFLGQSAALLQQIKQKGHDQLKKRGIIP